MLYEVGSVLVVLKLWQELRQMLPVQGCEVVDPLVFNWSYGWAAQVSRLFTQYVGLHEGQILVSRVGCHLMAHTVHAHALEVDESLLINKLRLLRRHHLLEIPLLLLLHHRVLLAHAFSIHAIFAEWFYVVWFQRMDSTKKANPTFTSTLGSLLYSWANDKIALLIISILFARLLGV